MKLFVVKYLVLILFLGSCTGDSPISTISPTKLPSRTELLTKNNSKEWKIVSAKVNGVESLKKCAEDDIYTFYANGNSTIDFGFLKCDTTEKDTENRTWYFTNDDKNIAWYTAKDTFNLSIIDIDERYLKLNQNGSINGNLAILALTFEAK